MRISLISKEAQTKDENQKSIINDIKPTHGLQLQLKYLCEGGSMPKDERVSDYPRPPRIEFVYGPVSVRICEEIIAEDTRYIRVCETFHPPTIYIHQEAFRKETLHKTSGRPSYCEWKGVAEYWSLSKNDGSELRARAGWSYPNPTGSFSLLADWIALYPRSVDACFLEGERVIPQPGTYYGGWITSWTIGPFKGDQNHPELI